MGGNLFENGIHLPADKLRRRQFLGALARPPGGGAQHSRPHRLARGAPAGSGRPPSSRAFQQAPPFDPGHARQHPAQMRPMRRGSRQEKPADGHDGFKQQKPFGQQGHGENEEDQQGDRIIRLPRRERRDQTEYAGGSSHHSPIKIVRKGQTQRHMAQAANGSAQEVKLEHVPGSNHLLHEAAKEIKPDHVARQVPNTAMHELEGEQLVELSRLQAGQAQGQMVVRPARRQLVQNHLDHITRHQADQQQGGHGPVLPLGRAHI